LIVRAILLLSLLPAIAGAQTFAVPPLNALLVEDELSAFDASAFNRYGVRVEIPGELRYFTNTIRLSYAPKRYLAIGGELPYRIVEYRAELGSRTVRSSGLAGAGIFADFIHHPLGLDAVARAGYLRSRRERDPVLTPSDGLDRFSVTYAAGKRTAFGHFEVVYGRKAYYSGTLQIAAGRRLTRNVDALLVANYRRTSESREEGSLLENEGGYSTAAGAIVQWNGPSALRVRLTAMRTLQVENGLDGVRVTLSAVRPFEFRK
jgi:hypothetical protein